MMVYRFSLVICLVISFYFSNFSVAADAVEKKKGANPPSQVTPQAKSPAKSQGLKIKYASSSWNKSSTRPDSAFLFVKEKGTGKLAKILLEESEPDSSIFSGQFSLGFTDADKLNPEIYIPPQNLRAGDAQTSQFFKRVESGNVQRKPFILRKDEGSSNLLDVYDTKEQAESAFKIYQEELKLRKDLAKANAQLTKPVPNEGTMATAEMVKQRVLLNNLALEAKARETDRLKMEQLERQRAKEKEELAKKLSEAERNRRIAEAKRLSELALQQYQNGQFAEAEGNFRKSIDLNPTNKSYYYRYGVTLYRNEKFNEALVSLKMAPYEQPIETEKKYYLGLIHYRLKELQLAEQAFSEVKGSNDPQTAPSAAFYLGMLHLSQERYEEAKGSFEYVLDQSSDPVLDRKAEEFIEQIIQIIQYKEQAKKKFLVSGMVGMTYDSNVLLAPDNETSQGSSLKQADVRGLFMGDLEYRIKYTPTVEWSAKANSLYMYSSKDAVSRADPWLTSVSSPIFLKGTFKEKGYRLGVKPGYEALYMDPNETGKKENILNTPYLSFDGTLINSDVWFSNYLFDVRRDDSILTDAVAANNSDSLKYAIKTTQSYFLDSTKKRALLGNLGYVLNSAEGKNKNYYRIEGGVSYMAPTKWDASWNLGLSVYTLRYPTADEARKDFNVTLSTGLQKPIRNWVTLGATANYSVNTSNTNANDYSKYTVMTMAIFNYAL